MSLYYIIKRYSNMAQSIPDAEDMIRGMNPHIPAARRSLLDYIEGDDLTYRTRGGDVCEIERAEIDLLASACSETDKMRLRLPIFVYTDITGDMPAWRVDGAAEAKVIAGILGRTQFRPDSVRFYHPDFRELSRKLPTSLVVVYAP